MWYIFLSCLETGILKVPSDFLQIQHRLFSSNWALRFQGKNHSLDLDGASEKEKTTGMRMFLAGLRGLRGFWRSFKKVRTEKLLMNFSSPH